MANETIIPFTKWMLKSSLTGVAFVSHNYKSPFFQENFIIIKLLVFVSPEEKSTLALLFAFSTVICLYSLTLINLFI